MPDEIYQPHKYFEDPAEKFARKYPHHHQTFFNRPDFTRRRFFQIAGSGVAGSYLMGQSASPAATIVSQNMATKNTAKNCIFILLTGAISPRDSWDLKITSDLNPAVVAQMNPTMINNVNWPVGIFPKLGQHLGDVALVRSMSAWALVHSLAQTWAQIGRNPAAALGNIAPNIGSVVAIEKDKERKPGQVFPPFIALNSGAGVGNGYFAATYAPFRLNQPTGTNGTAGIPGTTNSNGQSVFNTMFTRLHQIDDSLRLNSPYGQPLQDYDAFYSAAKGMMYNSAVTQAFTFSAADSQRYGVSNAGTSFGNACLVAKQILAADQGTRFVQITLGSWDMHQDIYGAQNPKGNNMYTLGPQPRRRAVGADRRSEIGRPVRQHADRDGGRIRQDPGHQRARAAAIITYCSRRCWRAAASRAAKSSAQPTATRPWLPITAGTRPTAILWLSRASAVCPSGGPGVHYYIPRWASTGPLSAMTIRSSADSNMYRSAAWERTARSTICGS